jgi:hypothetical protein
MTAALSLRERGDEATGDRRAAASGLFRCGPDHGAAG